MDPNIGRLYEKMNEKQHSHPNTIKIWREYIAVKHHNLLKDIDGCYDMLEKTNTNEDLSLEQMIITANIIKIITTTSNNNT
jgi:hypothetical protein